MSCLISAPLGHPPPKKNLADKKAERPVPLPTPETASGDFQKNRPLKFKILTEVHLPYPLIGHDTIRRTLCQHTAFR